jgi:exodeoxyribonuclease VII small subunit
MAKSSEKLPKFEEAIDELETIIDQIESGQVGLEECITQYERGMKLVTRCQSILDKAQQRIAELTATAGGKLEIKDQGDASDSADEETGAELDETNE